MAKIIDIIGERFGTLVVIENCEQNDKWGKPLWKCLCDCGNIIAKTKSDIAYKMKSCGCQRAEMISQARWDGYGEIAKTYWSSVICGATSRNIYFDVTIEYAWELFLKQNRKCALSGLEIQFSRNRKKTRDSYEVQPASLDRKNSSVGYINDNIQWVHKTINICKNDLSSSEFVNICRLVCGNQCS